MTRYPSRNNPSEKAVAHIATNHQPFDSRIFLKQARSLAAAGYKVHFVVPHHEDMVKDSVHIAAYPYPRGRFRRFLFAPWNAWRTARATNSTVFHLHDPDLLPMGWLLKLQGYTVIYDVHEDRPKQILSKAWLPRLLRPVIARAFRIIELFSYLVFDQFIVATPAIGETFPRQKTTVIHNYPIQDEFVNASGASNYEQRANQVIFVGGMTPIRGIKALVDAMALIPRRLAAQLLLVGTFETEAFQREVESSLGWNRVVYKGWQNRQQLAEHLESSKIGVVTYLPEPNHIAAQPNKLFEYMASGLPVVASDFPLWRELVSSKNTGLLVNPTKSDEIAKAITWLLENVGQACAMGQYGRQCVRQELNWTSQARILLDLYGRLCK